MERMIKISGKDHKFSATAATPLQYKNIFKADMIQKLMTLNEANPDIMFVEEVAYIMSGAHKGGINFEEWLEQFDFVELMESLPAIVELITDNSHTTAIAADGAGKNAEAAEN